MGKTFDCLTEEHMEWIKQQKVFFVASAAATGHVNASPKGHMDETFAVISPTRVAYLDFMGSGAETAAHISSNCRITLLFVALSGPPRIMRLHGNARLIRCDQAGEDLSAHFPEFSYKGARAVIVVDVHRFSQSCGYSIPEYEYVSQREVLKDVMNKMTREQIEDYVVLKNSFSIDKFPSVGHRVLGNDVPLATARPKGGYWFGYAKPTVVDTLSYYLGVTGPPAPGSSASRLWRDMFMVGVGAVTALLVLQGGNAGRQLK